MPVKVAPIAIRSRFDICSAIWIGMARLRLPGKRSSIIPIFGEPGASGRTCRGRHRYGLRTGSSSHLYAPRDLVRDSVMPAFPWLFDDAPDRPKQEARDLLAYLETLGRNRALAGPEGEAKAGDLAFGADH